MVYLGDVEEDPPPLPPLTEPRPAADQMLEMETQTSPGSWLLMNGDGWCWPGHRDPVSRQCGGRCVISRWRHSAAQSAVLTHIIHSVHTAWPGVTTYKAFCLVFI